ncbi:MAG: hypothetical protein R3C13_09210 [Hyphomonas sp.]|uniref:hypothetical protein n=1 Tax=Hyphomonas sp. TaxID=87 RepID=UPI0035294F7F
MRLFSLSAAVAAWGIASAPALAETESAEVPPACFTDEDGTTDYAACFNAAKPGTPAWIHAAINLGSEAFWDGDIETAAYYYDLSTPDGQQIFSDISFHANRADVFRRVGRLEDSLKDARHVWDMVQEGKYDFYGHPLNDSARFYVLMLVAQTFHEASAPEEEAVVRAFLETPIQNDTDLINQSAILTEIGKYDDALKLSAELVVGLPDNPGVLNNHCYLLTLMDRAPEGLPYCRQAAAIAPDIAALQHSLALALAAAGQCVDAEQALQNAHQLEPSVTKYSEPLACQLH